MSKITPVRAALFIITASVAILISALVFQYGFGFYPCALCFAQRWPYYFAISLAILALSLSRDARAGQTIVFVLIIIALVFLGSTALATYHVGIEQKWWEGIKACGSELRSSGLSLDELRTYLINQPIVRCDRPAWTLFGISLAGFNIVLSFTLTIVTAIFARIVARQVTTG